MRFFHRRHRFRRSRSVLALGVFIVTLLSTGHVGFLGGPPTPGRSTNEGAAVRAGAKEAIKEREDYLEQLEDDEGAAYQADLVGSPRPFFTLTEQWGLLGGLVGLV
eukprot:symbB.v1.2.002258.t1/scaffold92.1/size545918/15